MKRGILDGDARASDNYQRLSRRVGHVRGLPTCVGEAYKIAELSEVVFFLGELIAVQI